MIDERKIWKSVSRRFGSNDNSKAPGLCLLRTTADFDCPHLAQASQNLGLSDRALAAPVIDRDVLANRKNPRS